MDWTSEAEAAIKKVPLVSLSDVRQTQKRYLDRMSDEVKGYQLETCFGPGGCPNRAVDGDRLIERIEKILRSAEIRKFLEEHVKGGLKKHHEFRVTMADCPNACSQPQIKDVGIIGAVEPMITGESCSLCRACEETCSEGAITLKESDKLPVIDFDRCVRCGKCVQVCPAGTLAVGRAGYRIQLGGKLGRHPRLAEELPGIYSEDEVLEVLEKCIRVYKENSKHGERFAEILQHEKTQRKLFSDISG